MASGSPTSNFMLLQPCNAKSDLSASRYSSQWAMRRGASLRTRSGAIPAFRSDRPPRKCFFSLARITSPARLRTTYKERAQLAMRRAGGARSPRRRTSTAIQAALDLPGDAPLPPYRRRSISQATHLYRHTFKATPPGMTLRNGRVCLPWVLGGGRNRAPPARRIASCARSYVCFWPITPVADARDRFVCTTQYRAKRQSVRAQIPQE